MSKHKPPGAICQNCAYWDNGICRKDPPPVSFDVVRQLVSTVWRETNWGDWCSQFAPDEDAWTKWRADHGWTKEKS